MPAEPRWLRQIPRIIEELSALDMPVVDRPVIEQAFGVRRRRAVQLPGWFGGYLVGRTFVVKREVKSWSAFAKIARLRGWRFRFRLRLPARTGCPVCRPECASSRAGSRWIFREPGSCLESSTAQHGPRRRISALSKLR